MSVYVDQARHRFGRMTMCHMVADTLGELHDMAASIGMRRVWFQPRSFPHYDVSLTRRELAIAGGAIVVNNRWLARWMRQQRRQGIGPRNTQGASGTARKVSSAQLLGCASRIIDRAPPGSI